MYLYHNTYSGWNSFEFYVFFVMPKRLAYVDSLIVKKCEDPLVKSVLMDFRACPDHWTITLRGLHQDWKRLLQEDTARSQRFQQMHQELTGGCNMVQWCLSGGVAQMCALCQHVTFAFTYVWPKTRLTRGRSLFRILQTWSWLKMCLFLVFMFLFDLRSIRFHAITCRSMICPKRSCMILSSRSLKVPGELEQVGGDLDDIQVTRQKWLRMNSEHWPAMKDFCHRQEWDIMGWYTSSRYSKITSTPSIMIYSWGQATSVYRSIYNIWFI